MPAEQPKLTLQEIARTLFRHRGKMALFFCSVIATTLFGIAIYPRSYSSESKLFVQVGRETVALDPTATTGQTMVLNKSQADEINSAVEMLTSTAVHRRVVEALGSDRILRDQSPADFAASNHPLSITQRLRNIKGGVRAWVTPTLRRMGLSDPASDVDLAIRQLADGVEVRAPKDSMIITVEYRAASPELAHDVVDATTKAFLDQHVELNRVEGSLEFFSEQAEMLLAALVDAQSELRDCKNEFEISSLDSQRAIFGEQVKDVELERLKAQRDLVFSEARAAELTEVIANLKPEIVTSRVAGVANVARDGMREKLYELELQESKLRSSYQDNHPMVIQIRKQRQQAEEIIAAMPDDRTQTTSSPNPNQRQLELELMQAQADVNALRARRAASDEQLSKLRDQLQSLNDRELRVKDLDRNVEILEGKYRMHVEKLEQARVNDELGRGRITNIKVAQPATMLSNPVAPNKRLLMALGTIIATCGAVGLAFLAENLDQTFRTAEQIEQELGVPVVHTFSSRKRPSRGRVTSSNGTAGAAVEENGRQNGHAHSVSDREAYEELFETNGNGRPHFRTVGVVGCDDAFIRSKAAASLAMRAAKMIGGPVLLIDADARHRRVAKRFDANAHEVSSVAAAESAIQWSKGGKLSAAASGDSDVGTLTMEPANGIASEMEAAKADYQLVVVDLPPGLTWAGSPVGANGYDEIVIVIEAERTHIEAARRMKRTLERSGLRLTGAILANRCEHIPRWLYQRL